MMHKLLLGLTAGLLSLTLACGEDKDKKKANNFAQPEDANQLTLDPLMTLKTFDGNPENLVSFNEKQILDRVSQLPNLTNPSFENNRSQQRSSDSNTLESRSVMTLLKDQRKAANNQKRASDGCVPHSKWELQNEATFVQEKNIVVANRRWKYLCTTREDTVYIYKNDQFTFGCQGATMSGFEKGTVEDFVNNYADTVCTGGDLIPNVQEHLLIKTFGQDGNNVVSNKFVGSVHPRGYCRYARDQEQEKVAVSCGWVKKTVHVVTKEGETVPYMTENIKAIWDNTVYNKDYKFYEAGSLQFIMNDWVGDVQFESTGNNPTVQLKNIFEKEQEPIVFKLN